MESKETELKSILSAEYLDMMEKEESEDEENE